MEDNQIFLQEEQSSIDIVESIEVIDVYGTETYDIDSDAAFPALGETNEGIQHQLLNGKELADQHPITAITGLRGELDAIEALQVVYSNEKNQADYYLWEDGNPAQEARDGLFVTLCRPKSTSSAEDTNKIKICTESDDILGVTVDSAAFIGGQDNIARDCNYGLVAHGGVAMVRCELDVVVGSYVISDKYGMAKMSDTGYGHKVFALAKRGDVSYAIIAFGVPANLIYDMSQDVDELEERMTDAEMNIIAIMNVANEAYNKALAAGTASGGAAQSAQEALDALSSTIGSVGEIEANLGKANALAEEAKKIAQDAIIAADRIGEEAKEAANQALGDAMVDIGQIQQGIFDDMASLQEAVDGLDYAVEDLGKTRDEWAEKIAGVEGDVAEFRTEIADTYATAEQFATFKTDTTAAIASVKTEAHDNKAILNSIVGFKYTDDNGKETTGLAGMAFQIDKNRSDAKMLASTQTEHGAAISGITSMTKEHSASLSALARFEYGNIEPIYPYADSPEKDDETHGGNVYMNGITFTDNGDGTITVNGNASANADFYLMRNKELTAGTYGISGCPEDAGDAVYFIAKVGDKTYVAIQPGEHFEVTEGTSVSLWIRVKSGATVSDLKFMPQFKQYYSGIAGLREQVTKNGSSIDLLSGFESGSGTGTAGLMTMVSDHEAKFTNIASWKKDHETSITTIQGMAEANESNIELVTSRINGQYDIIADWPDEDKRKTGRIYYESESAKYWAYSDGSWQQATRQELVWYLNNKKVYYVSGTKEYWWYKDGTWTRSTSPEDAGLPMVLASIHMQTDENSSAISSITSWQNKTTDSIASIKQKADDDGASIELLVAGVEKYSVGEYSQSYGLTHEQAKNILKNGVVYVPTKHENSSTQTHWETFADTDEDNAFTAGNYYIWKDGDWEEHIGGVSFYSGKPSNASGNLKYWYINSQTAPDGYEPYTLYTYEKSSSGSYYWSKVGTLAGNALNRATSMIRQTTNEIAADVTNARGDYASLNARLEADRSAQVAMVASVVGEDGKVNTASIVAAVNDKKSSVAINGDHIVLNGATTNGNGSFQIHENGYMIATGGNIGGWDITRTNIQKEHDLKRLYICSNPGANNEGYTYDSWIAAGTKSSTSAEDWDWPFYVLHDGTLGATKAKITGTITANAGSKIGPWTLSATTLRAGGTGGQKVVAMQVPNDGGAYAFAVGGESHSSYTDCPFRVRFDGTLIAEKAEIEGKITADEGQIGGWTIAPTQKSGSSYNSGIYADHKIDGSDYRVGMKLPTKDDTSPGDRAAFYVTKNPLASSASREAVFYVQNNGKLFAKNADIKGKITADEGSIANWNMQDGSLFAKVNKSDGKYTILKSGGSVAFATGVPWDNPHTDTSYAQLQIYHDGRVYAGYNGSSYNFQVATSGNVTVKGTITAGSGSKIGGWSITNNTIETWKSKDKAFFINCNPVPEEDPSNKPNDGTYDSWIAAGVWNTSKQDWDWPFYVLHDGTMRSEKAKIWGTLTCEAGSKIGDFKVDTNSVYSGSWSSGSCPKVFMCTGSTGSGFSLGGSPVQSDWYFGAKGSNGSFGVTGKGEVYANAGQIGGWTIVSGGLSSGSSNIYKRGEFIFIPDSNDNYNHWCAFTESDNTYEFWLGSDCLFRFGDKAMTSAQFKKLVEFIDKELK